MSFNPAGFGGYLLFMTHQSTAAVAHCFMMHLMKSIHHIHAKAGVGYMFWGLVIWTKSGEHFPQHFFHAVVDNPPFLSFSPAEF